MNHSSLEQDQIPPQGRTMSEQDQPRARECRHMFERPSSGEPFVCVRCGASLAAYQAESVDHDHLGLSIDMLDADRLDQWADNIETYGHDLTQWASTAFLTQAMREMSKNIREAVRDIGQLRAGTAPGKDL